MQRALIIAALSSLTLPGLASAAVSAETFKKFSPPPGLYRLDTDGTVRVPETKGDATIKQRTDGATGNTSTRIAKNGKNHDRDFKGTGPVKFCVAPNAGKPAAIPPGLASAACKTVSESITGNALTMQSQCAIGKMTLTIRQLGKDTWEYVSAVDMQTQNGAQGGAQNMNAMRPMLENAARNAPSAEERAQATAALAQLPAQQAQMSKELAQVKADMLKEQATASPEEAAAIAEALKSLDQGGAAMQANSRTVWTRIGDKCT